MSLEFEDPIRKLIDRYIEKQCTWAHNHNNNVFNWSGNSFLKTKLLQKNLCRTSWWYEPTGLMSNIEGFLFIVFFMRKQVPKTVSCTSRPSIQGINNPCTLHVTLPKVYSSIASIVAREQHVTVAFYRITDRSILILFY